MEELISIELLLQTDAPISGWGLQIWPSLRHPRHPNERSIRNTLYRESGAKAHLLGIFAQSFSRPFLLKQIKKNLKSFKKAKQLPLFLIP